MRRWLRPRVRPCSCSGRRSATSIWAGRATEAGLAFRAWQAEQGLELEQFCRFQVLAGLVAREHGQAMPFQAWRPEWRRPDTAEVARLADAQRDSVDRQAFLQWLADRQLAQAHQRARRAGMRIGLYADLATGVVPDGAEAWADPQTLIDGVTMGAPPDPLGPFGQNWHVVAPSPLVLARTDAAPLRATLRAVMRHAGAMRIDHALGLLRLFLIPPGASAAAGAYLRFPYGRLLRAVAEEARAAGCVVIGEDWAPSPTTSAARCSRPACSATGWPGSSATGKATAASCRPSGSRPRPWPRSRPTTCRRCGAGSPARTFSGASGCGSMPTPRVPAAYRRLRAHDAGLLLDRLRASGLLGHEDVDIETRSVALHGYLARAASTLAAVQLEDLMDELEQPNLPGTVTEHPNWQRRYRHPVDTLTAEPLAARILAVMAAERPR